MTVEATPVVPAPRSGRLVWQLLGLVVVAILGYETIHFWLRDPLHYIVDQSEASFRNYWPRRWWLLLHIAGGTLALFMGPFQFWTGFRDRHMRTHRITGYLYLTGIVLGGIGAFYMAFYSQPADFGVALFGLASAWWITVAMAFIAIRRGRTQPHKEWMIRGYVVTFAFVAFRYLIDLPVWKPLGPAAYSNVIWISWVAPLMIAEVVLQWKRTVGAKAIPRHG